MTNKRNNIIYVYYIMPPKRKPKPKPKGKQVKKAPPKGQAYAQTGRGQAQAQTTNVVVRIGETKKSAPRKRGPAKPKLPPPPPPGGMPPRGPDGWLPPQNLSRSGSIFAPAETIRYVNVPTPSQTSFLAGATPAPPPSFTDAFGGGGDVGNIPPIAPELQSGEDTTFAPEPSDWTDVLNEYTGISKGDLISGAKEVGKRVAKEAISRFIRPTVSGTPIRSPAPAPEEPLLNMTEWLSGYKASKRKEPLMLDLPESYYQEEPTSIQMRPLKRKETLVAPPPEEPTFAPPSYELPSFIPPVPAPAPIPIPEERNITQASIIQDIKNITRQILGDDAPQKERKDFNEIVYGGFGKKKSDLSGYNKNQLTEIRDIIRAVYGK